MLSEWRARRRQKYERACWLAHKRHELNLAIEQAVLDEVISPDQADILDLRFGLKDGKKRSIAQVAKMLSKARRLPGILGAEKEVELSLWATKMKFAKFTALDMDLDELESKALNQLGYEMTEVEAKELENSRSIDQLRRESEMEKRVLAKEVDDMSAYAQELYKELQKRVADKTWGKQVK